MQKRLAPKEWGKHYNSKLLDEVVRSVQKKHYSAQTSEMLLQTSPQESILEIGCGSGATSLALACGGRICTALDNAEEVVHLVSSAAQTLQCHCKVMLADAEQELPFDDNAFDVSFQAGLLEHYHREERIRLLSLWGRVSKRMISLIPNAASLAYRVGKARMEKKGIWPYGLEIPQYSLSQEFAAVGFDVIREYTIGERHSLEFLPRWHPLRLVLSRLMDANSLQDNAGQGYLLVTIGKKRDIG